MRNPDVLKRKASHVLQEMARNAPASWSGSGPYSSGGMHLVAPDTMGPFSYKHYILPVHVVLRSVARGVFYVIYHSRHGLHRAVILGADEMLHVVLSAPSMATGRHTNTD